MKKSKKNPDKVFPEFIFVQKFGSGGAAPEDGYLIASESTREALDSDLGTRNAGEVVACYRLKSVGKIIQERPEFIED